MQNINEFILCERHLLEQTQGASKQPNSFLHQKKTKKLMKTELRLKQIWVRSI